MQGWPNSVIARTLPTQTRFLYWTLGAGTLLGGNYFAVANYPQWFSSAQLFSAGQTSNGPMR
jgi:hypothetical protein